VATGANELERSVTATERIAESVGANTTALEALRSEARNLSGGEVAELARGVGLGPATAGGKGGPPVSVGEADGANGLPDVPGGDNGPPENGQSEADGRTDTDDGTESDDRTEADDTGGTSDVEADPRRDDGGESSDGGLGVGPPAGVGDDAVGDEDDDDGDGDEE
jgi:hypothetical protein